MSRIRNAGHAAELLRTGQTWPTMAADLRRMVPRWHFEMLADNDRNLALAGAIYDAVTPGDLVLDIGTGAGLTALIAAQAGAEVVTCEVNPVVAELASQIIRENGYADRITVVNEPSTVLKIGKHLPRPADVLVAEVFDADVFSEGAGPTFADAINRLTTPQTKILPQRGEVWCTFVESFEIERLNHVGIVGGFDLSRFNQVATQEVLFATLQNWFALGPPVKLFDLDFTKPLQPDVTQQEVQLTHQGILHAACITFELHLDDRNILSNRIGSGSHWKQSLWTLDRRAVGIGDTITVNAAHDIRSMSLHIKEE